MLATAKGVLEQSTRNQQDLRVVSGSLAGGRTVEVPDREILGASGDGGDGLGLGTSVVVSVNPDVLDGNTVLVGV